MSSKKDKKQKYNELIFVKDACNIDEQKHQKDDHDYDKNHHEADIVEDADQYSTIDQESNELIFIKDSCNINVQSTNTQAAVSLQVGLQLAIALVIRITIADSDEGENVAQDLLQHLGTEQTNKQRIVIENSKDITVTTTDTDLSANIQALLQVLLTLVAKLDII